MFGFRSVVTVVLWAIAAATGACNAEEVKRIQDNSFLIEEAYNQETGVVQHIQTYQRMRGGDWAYTFTQEWPASTQKHQLSYTIPVLRPEDGFGASHLGDIALNYRYQAILKGPIAFSPRLSLLLPTGDYKKGVGSGSTGFQVNLPLSIETSSKWVTHCNTGFTFVPNAKEPGGAQADTLGFNIGASAIYSATNKLNLMLEALWTSEETVLPGGSTDRQSALLISPGLRYAIDTKSGMQIVPGVAFPTGIGPSRGDSGLFLYLSLEHPFK